tara:strand:- start:691 stop:1296 length:606 start_codon:yes stop_codon:yes gene_type:complete
MPSEEIKDPFIWVKDNALPKDICKETINRFERYKNHQQQGIIGKGIDVKIKDSQDLLISSWMDFRDICMILTAITSEELFNYRNHCSKLNKKSFTTNNDISLTLPSSVIENLIVDRHQVQKTSSGKGYTWHNDTVSYERRVLTYIYYLNDVEDGWTEFWQGDKIAPKEGRLLIFPSIWTYFHQGYPPKQDKYISIGWASCF